MDWSMDTLTNLVNPHSATSPPPPPPPPPPLVSSARKRKRRDSSIRNGRSNDYSAGHERGMGGRPNNPDDRPQDDSCDCGIKEVTCTMDKELSILNEENPLGFRFAPTEEELIIHLKGKLHDMKLKHNIIVEADVFSLDADDIPRLSPLKDDKWFFFTHLHTNEKEKQSRQTKSGCWKSTGLATIIENESRIFGIRKIFVYHVGKGKCMKRTDWVIHQFTLTHEELSRCRGLGGNYAICMLFKKKHAKCSAPTNAIARGEHVEEVTLNSVIGEDNRALEVLENLLLKEDMCVPEVLGANFDYQQHQSSLVTTEIEGGVEPTFQKDLPFDELYDPSPHQSTVNTNWVPFIDDDWNDGIIVTSPDLPPGIIVSNPSILLLACTCTVIQKLVEYYYTSCNSYQMDKE